MPSRNFAMSLDPQAGGAVNCPKCGKPGIGPCRAGVKQAWTEKGRESCGIGSRRLRTRPPELVQVLNSDYSQKRGRKEMV